MTVAPPPCRPSASPGPADRARTLQAGDMADLAVGRALTWSERLVDDDEVVILLLRPSPWYVPLASAGGLLGIAAFTLALAWMSTRSWAGWTEAQAFALGAGLALVRLGWQCIAWFNRLYILTDRRIIRRMGTWRITVFETPLRRIHHASVFATVRERLFGLGTLGFATTDSEYYEAFWVMLRDPVTVQRIVVNAIKRYGR